MWLLPREISPKMQANFWCFDSSLIPLCHSPSALKHAEADGPMSTNDDVIKRKHLPRYWPFIRGCTVYPVDSLHKMQWRGALMFSLICAWINGLANTRDGGHLGRHRAHYDVTVMYLFHHWLWWWLFAWFSLGNSLHFDGLMQERRNSSALAMVLRRSCINPSICHYHFFTLNIGIGGYVKELWCSGAMSQWFH